MRQAENGEISIRETLPGVERVEAKPSGMGSASASLLMAPVDSATAREMINEVRGLAPIRGYRNMPKGDLDALAGAVAAVSRLAAIERPCILEAEINPLCVAKAGGGVLAVDALIRLTP